MDKQMTVKYMEPRNLKEHPKNRNTHTRNQIKRLAKLIQDQGFRVPIIVSELSGFIVAGHGRLVAAKRLKLENVPVIYQSFDNEDEEYKFLVADNAIAQWSELNLTEIRDDLKDIGPLDTELLGIKGFEKNELASNKSTVPKKKSSNFDNKCPKCSHEWNDK